MPTATKTPGGASRARPAAALTVCLLACAAAPTFAQDRLSVRTDSPFVIVRAGARDVLRYRYAEVPCKPYVEELRSPAGVNVLRDAPDDHKHHHALMFAVAVDGVNFWEEHVAPGHQVHRQLSDLTTAQHGSLHRAGFTHSVDWSNPRDGALLLQERRRIEVYAGADLDASLLTWQADLSAPPGKSSVVLTGTAYFGLGLRFPKSMDVDGRFTNAEGHTGASGTNDQRAGWCAYAARVDNAPVTVAVFDHPKNPRHPATWFTMDTPFAYLANTLNLAKKPLTIDADRPLVLRYGVAVWDGHVEPSRIERLYRRWTQLPSSSSDLASARAQAVRNARLGSRAFSEMHRWLHAVALPRIDSTTKLFRATGDEWNYRDTAADCYPFLGWAAFFTDRAVFEGPVRDALHAEQKLCSHHGPVPVNFDFRTGRKQADQRYDSVVFGASEYMKDGLVAIVEAAGPGAWLDRMRAITDELWRRAAIDSPHGKLVSSNLEVNGDQLQVLVRLFGLTGDERYLEYARRIADHYLEDPAFLPRHLDDHGCELIGGIGLLQGVESTVDPAREKRLRPRIKKMLDTILARGLNSDGLMLHTLADTPGPHDDKPLTDNWGYNYVAHYCYYLVTGDTHYRDVLRRPLVNLAKPKYHLYPWEGKSIDGHADSIEGALYLLSVVPVSEGVRWIDREVADALLAKPIAGTSKFECNAIRTLTLYALSKTQGIHVPAWREDLRLGAVRTGDGVVVHVAAQRPWHGKLIFDLPRHRQWFRFRHDWPRINYLPEYFTVEPTGKYRVRIGSADWRTMTGQALRDGLPIEVGAQDALFLVVEPE